MVWNESLKREIPEKWKVVKIRELANTCSGGTPDASNDEYYLGGGIPWINSGELNSAIITHTQNFITQQGLDNSSAKWYPANTILIALYGATAGKVSLLSFPATSNQAVCGIIVNNEKCRYYLYLYLRSLYKYYISLSSGSARDNISQVIVRQTEILLPPLQLLEKYYNQVSSVFEKIVDNDKEIFCLIKQRDELLPLLMNGQINCD